MDITNDRRKGEIIAAAGGVDQVDREELEEKVRRYRAQQTKYHEKEKADKRRIDWVTAIKRDAAEGKNLSKYSSRDIENANKADLEAWKTGLEANRAKKEQAGRQAREAQKELDALEQQVAKRAKSKNCSIEQTPDGRTMFRGTHLNLSYLGDCMMERRDPRIEASNFYRAVGTLEGIKKITYKSGMELLRRLQESFEKGDPAYDRATDLLENLRQLKSCLKKASLVQQLQTLIFKDDLKIKAENVLNLYVANYSEEAKQPASSEVLVQKILEDPTFKKRIPVSDEYPNYLKGKIERYNKCYFKKVDRAYKAYENDNRNRGKGRKGKPNKKGRNNRNSNNNNQKGNSQNNNNNNNNNNGNSNRNNKNRNNARKGKRQNNRPQGNKQNQSDDQWAEEQNAKN